MASRLKLEVKAGARRRGERPATVSEDRISFAEATIGEWEVLAHQQPMVLSTSAADRPRGAADAHNDMMEPLHEASTLPLPKGPDCTLTRKGARESMTIGRSETVLLMFYIEDLLPFTFPFYCPSLLHGGKSWILDMLISSPVVRQAALCQSSYFFSLARGTADHEGAWDTVLKQTRDAFEVLRQSLQVIGDSDITEHLHGAVRILASVMQIQRFEIAILSFNNCQAHLNAALALFEQLLDSAGGAEEADPSSSFNTILSRLGPLSWDIPVHCAEVPSAEQTAFRFSSTLLIFDDIIASMLLQQHPRLHKFHRSLLGNSIIGAENPVNLEAVIGCQNWVLLQMGEIAVLDAWKSQCQTTATLDVMELVQRAKFIKASLETCLKLSETSPGVTPKETSSLLNVFTANYCEQTRARTSQIPLVTRVWAHAALVYLFVVVSGWQPASIDVRYHVDQILQLLTHQISTPALLRTVVWPFCVAGCLAEPAQEVRFRDLVQALQPPSIFGTVRKALDIMENVWRNRNAPDVASRDLAACFRSQGDLVLLV
ncbi:fungal-specific transcription factor domain-containing protein [Exophiala viscosa]|uniref:Fungal-specific transcription factor domain-containing protein n=1 Tax=Exophiala viscosa TaxID=2486360 RepID=A0AAN6IHV8_9EURO|nr:fungal-specific transcription factor domain-containing protein [Exophiala viscosa]KAI1627785.1 fungal-specific transcription factor domain-containing protein [Exophiala viscosa]